MNYNNSAHRLCNILEKAIEIGGDEKNTSIVIGKAMEVEDVSEKCFMTDFFVLFSDVERSILHLRDVPKKTAYLNTIRGIQTIFFSHSLCSDHWPNIRNTIKSSNLTLILDACANFIARENPLINLNESQLQDYLSQCEELLSEITKSDLDNDLKIFLVRRLEEVCTAIRHYSIGGSERLQTLVEANIGGIHLRNSGISEKDKNNPVLKKLLTCYAVISSVISTAANVQTLSGSNGLEHFLLPASQVSRHK